jgi:N-acetylglucosaminyldiphosphoundecaprenol N-acetyl-beta-D-mannosaminyltransferase
VKEEQHVISMRVNVTSQQQVVNDIVGFIEQDRSAYICVSNVHMCMETFDSESFRKVVNNADLVIPDGRPIYWAQKLLGHSQAQQVRGQDITHALCKLSNDTGIKIGLYGGSSDEVLAKVEQNLLLEFPNIQITYKYSPPFRPLNEDESNVIAHKINLAEVDVLFVGIGCPKQENWMAANKDKVNAVMLGVGAVFDFIAGTKKHAPRWMQKLGLEWLFRLVSEPKRLWKRYLKQNPRFIWYFLQQWLFNKKFD